MPKRSVLEMKIRWYFNTVEPTIDKDALEIILLSQFDENGDLKLSSGTKNAVLYDRYWKKLSGRLDKKI